MTITYSCVANGRAVLAELALTGGSYQEAAAKVLRQVLLKAEPVTIIQIGSYVYHTLFIGGITYLCATDNGLDTLAPSAFLKKVSDIFTRNPLMSQDHFFPSNALATDFQQILAEHMVPEVEFRSYPHIHLPGIWAKGEREQETRGGIRVHSNKAMSSSQIRGHFQFLSLDKK
ncbi:vesicle-associated membrane protein 7-like isoform X3 [Mesocricetus auratus]|uniref:Vesicle-associated membrane protein 7-like isoform X3 n=1 Tax=Mesocricetus auratus TaxID=10036 RepID=A0ABM2XKZ0_MESAU|nr:vesicle-associated membrane protein 7-like isoform X3 [Mesocricetus auratus]